MIVLAIMTAISYYVGNRYMKYLIFNMVDKKQIRKNNVVLAVIGVIAGIFSVYFDNVFSVMCGFVLGVMFGLIGCGFIAEREMEK